jgi:hypothetical protein
MSGGRVLLAIEKRICAHRYEHEPIVRSGDEIHPVTALVTSTQE